MFRYLLITILALSVLLATGCQEPVNNAEQPQSVNAVSGKLNLFLHRRDAIGLYVHFELKEQEKNRADIIIAQSDFIRISEHPVPFSLTFPPGMVKQEKFYLLNVTVSDGAVEITRMSAPVLTQGHPSVIDLAIQQPPEPIE